MTNSDTSVSPMTELEQTRSLVEGILAALPCGVAIVNSDYQIIDANPAYFEPLGLDRSEVCGRYCHEAFGRHPNPCSMSDESCPIAAARTTGTISRVCREHRLPDGRIRNLEYTANPLLDGHGGISAFVVVVNDLTGLREAEGQLQQAVNAQSLLNPAQRRQLDESARRLEQANVELIRLGRARNEFVVAVSQELRTPLAAISEGVELVEDGSFGALNADQQGLLRLAGRNTKRLADLLNDLLDLSRIEVGSMEVHRQRLDLCRIAREAAATYDSIARDNHQILKVDLPESLEPVLADEQSVLRILSHLIGNAVKFTSSGGCITIAADRDGKGSGTGDQGTNPNTQYLAPDTRPRITVSVSDTGIGIPRNQQDPLLGKLEPVNQPGDVRPRPAGLGLALSRRLVELNEGRIWLESAEGTGSRFSFTLPVYTEFDGLTADLQYLASTMADWQDGTPAVYCFRVQPGKAGNGMLPKLEELLGSLFPKPVTLSVVGSASGILAFVPRKLLERELQSVVESLKESSLFVGKPKAGLQFGVLNYDQLKLRLQASAADRSAPAADSAARWWDTLFDELKPGLKEIQ